MRFSVLENVRFTRDIVAIPVIENRIQIAGENACESHYFRGFHMEINAFHPRIALDFECGFGIAET